MSNYTAVKIDDMHSLHGGAMRLARASLGVSSFGMQVEEFPPGFDNTPRTTMSTTGRRRSTWFCGAAPRWRSTARA